MIYSKQLQSYVPVTISSQQYDLRDFGRYTKYWVHHDKKEIGYVDLLDLEDGVDVQMIANNKSNLYKGFGVIADQLEVEHCLKRGLSDFKIISQAAMNSHALHYLRGKRFVEDKFNKIVESIIKSTPKGEQYNTRFLGFIDMYMPKELIQKYIEIIKKFPLLKDYIKKLPPY